MTRIKQLILCLILPGLLQAQTIVTINPANHYTEVEGWGASLCWWAHMTGQWKDEKKIDEIIDLITSPDKLNMNIFRYNIGGGDDPSHYSTPEKKGHMAEGKGIRAEMEGFKPAENEPYNWDADAGQRKIMLKIKEKRPDAIFEAFSNSPPYWMTYSGCSAGNSPASADNLKPQYYDAFCDYLVDVCKHYKETFGIEFKTLEPFNESLSNYWGKLGSQEGCHFGVNSQMTLIRRLYPKLKASGLNTVISASDETSLKDFMTALNAYINAGDILEKVGQLNVHTYSASDSERAQTLDLVGKTGKTFWQSETGPMGISGSGLSNNIQLAQKLFLDMNGMRPAAWLDWQLLEEWNDTWCQIRCSFENETYSIVKNYYVRMQVTRFIKQGYPIVESGNKDVLAAISPDQNELVISLINNSGSAQRFDFNLTSFYAIDKPVKVYRTSSSENCRQLANLSVAGSVLSYSAPDQTITTFVLNAQPVAYDFFKITKGITFEDDSLEGFSGENLLINENPQSKLLNASAKCLSGALDDDKTIIYNFERPFIPQEGFRYLHVMGYNPLVEAPSNTQHPDDDRIYLNAWNEWEDWVVDLSGYESLEKLEFASIPGTFIDNLVIDNHPEPRQITQQSPVFDFESSSGIPVYEFRNMAGKKASGSVVSNPDFAGLNMLGKVFRYLLPSVGNAAIAEDTLIISLSSPLIITGETSYLHLMIKSPLNKIDVSVSSVSQSKTFTKDKWVDLVIDLKSLKDKIIREIKLSPYGQKDLNTILFLDNICFNSNASPLEYTYQPPGKNPYLIVSRKSGHALTPFNSGIIQSDLSFENEAQQWLFNPVSGGYNIMNLSSNLVITDNGSYYLALEKENAAGQVFTVNSLGDGFVRLTSVSTGKSFDVEGESTNAGAKIGLWSYGASGNTHRQWSLIEISKGTSSINNLPESKNNAVVYSSEGQLFLGGLQEKASFEVFNMNGMLIKRGITETFPHPLIKGRGMFIVKVQTSKSVRAFKVISS